MARTRDMHAFDIGRVYGECTIIGRDGNNIHVRCSCGHEFTRTNNNVRRGGTCRMCYLKNVMKYRVGAVINGCTIIDVIDAGKEFRFRCHCGNEFTRRMTPSTVFHCGCMHDDNLMTSRMNRALARVGIRVGPFTLLRFVDFDVNDIPRYEYQTKYGIHVATLRSITTNARYREKKDNQ